MSEVTVLLRSAAAGEPQALSLAYVAILDDLRAAAHRQLLRNRGTLQTTQLVNETWLKLGSAGQLEPKCREHFMALAARAMRQIVIDHVRRRCAQRRGCGVAALDIDDHGVELPQPGLPLGDLVALDDALERLAQMDARLGQLVEMRYFGGFTDAEIAGALGVNERTVQRNWRKARAWLLDSLR